MIRFNVRDAVQSAASIVEGQMAGRQAAMDQLQAQQQQALQNRLRLFQYGQESENANRKVLADLLPDVDPSTQGGILETLNQPSRYSPEALMRPGPLDLSSAPKGMPGGMGGPSGPATDATRPNGILPNTQQFLGRSVSSSLFGGQPNSEATATPSPSMGGGMPGTSASPATLSPAGQVQAADSSLNNMASSPLGDPAERIVTSRQMAPGNTASPGLEWLARGTPAGAGNTAAPVASAPSGQGGPQRPDKKQGKLTHPLQPAVPPTAGAGGAGTGAAFSQQPLPPPEEAAPGAAQRSFFSPYQKQQQPAAQPPAQPPADQGATGTAGGNTATTPEGVPFTYQGAHGPATGYYTGGNRSPAQQEARAAQDANQLWGVIGAKAILPDSPLAKLLDQYGADLTGPFNSPASVQKFYTALAKVRPHLGESLETQTEVNRVQAEKDRKQHEQDQSDADIAKSLNAFAQKEYQSQGQYEASVAGLNAYRGSERVKDFIRRNPSYAHIVVPPFKGYQKPADADVAATRAANRKIAESNARGIPKREAILNDQLIQADLKTIRDNAGKPASQKKPTTADRLGPFLSRLNDAEKKLKEASIPKVSAKILEGSVTQGQALDPVERNALHALHERDYYAALYSAQRQRIANEISGIPPGQRDQNLTPAEAQAILRWNKEKTKSKGVTIKERKR